MKIKIDNDHNRTDIRAVIDIRMAFSVLMWPISSAIFDIFKLLLNTTPLIWVGCRRGSWKVAGMGIVISKVEIQYVSHKV